MMNRTHGMEVWEVEVTDQFLEWWPQLSVESKDVVYEVSWPE